MEKHLTTGHPVNKQANELVLKRKNTGAKITQIIQIIQSWNTCHTSMRIWVLNPSPCITVRLGIEWSQFQHGQRDKGDRRTLETHWPITLDNWQAKFLIRDLVLKNKVDNNLRDHMLSTFDLHTCENPSRHWHLNIQMNANFYHIHMITHEHTHGQWTHEDVWSP